MVSFTGDLLFSTVVYLTNIQIYSINVAYCINHSLLGGKVFEMQAAENQKALGILPGHEVIGTRQLGEWPNDDLVRLWISVSSGIVKYGFVIEYRDLEPPRTGIFDGLKIVVDPDVGFEMQCFLLLHLFGHSVQWVAPSLECKLGELQNTQDKKRFLQVLYDYEFEAACFGMQLILETGVSGLDQWYSDFVSTDWRYVERYYQTGVLPGWKTCVVHDCPIILPKPIPELRHRQVEVRFAF